MRNALAYRASFLLACLFWEFRRSNTASFTLSSISSMRCIYNRRPIGLKYTIEGLTYVKDDSIRMWWRESEGPICKVSRHTVCLATQWLTLLLLLASVRANPRRNHDADAHTKEPSTKSAWLPDAYDSAKRHHAAWLACHFQ